MIKGGSFEAVPTVNTWYYRCHMKPQCVSTSYHPKKEESNPAGAVPGLHWQPEVLERSRDWDFQSKLNAINRHWDLMEDKTKQRPKFQIAPGSPTMSNMACWKIHDLEIFIVDFPIESPHF